MGRGAGAGEGAGADGGGGLVSCKLVALKDLGPVAGLCTAQRHLAKGEPKSSACLLSSAASSACREGPAA